MRYSALIRERVCLLRKQGLSLEEIFVETNIPKTTIHGWVKNIVLSQDHKDNLRERTQRALQEGRKKVQNLNKKIRIEKEKSFFNKGINEVDRLNKKEFFIAGIALYWAEGFKNLHERRLGFCNSDPTMITFYIKWLKDILYIRTEDIVARLTLNESYKDSTKNIEKYWSEITGIPMTQFAKAFYQHTQWKKRYNTDNYHGVLRIHVKNSLDYLLRMKGWIEGLKLNIKQL